MRFRLCLSWIQIDKKNQGIHHKGDISLVTWKWLQGQRGIERIEEGIELLSCFSIDALLLRYNWLLRRFCIFLSGEWDVSLSLQSSSLLSFLQSTPWKEFSCLDKTCLSFWSLISYYFTPFCWRGCCFVAVTDLSLHRLVNKLLGSCNSFSSPSSFFLTLIVFLVLWFLFLCHVLPVRVRSRVQRLFLSFILPSSFAFVCPTHEKDILWSLKWHSLLPSFFISVRFYECSVDLWVASAFQLPSASSRIIYLSWSLFCGIHIWFVYLWHPRQREDGKCIPLLLSYVFVVCVS